MNKPLCSYEIHKIKMLEVVKKQHLENSRNLQNQDLIGSKELPMAFTFNSLRIRLKISLLVKKKKKIKKILGSNSFLRKPFNILDTKKQQYIKCSRWMWTQTFQHLSKYLKESITLVSVNQGTSN